MEVGYIPSSFHPQDCRHCQAASVDSVDSFRILIGFDWSTRIIAYIVSVTESLSESQNSNRHTPARSAHRSPEILCPRECTLQASSFKLQGWPGPALAFSGSGYSESLTQISSLTYMSVYETSDLPVILYGTCFFSESLRSVRWSRSLAQSSPSRLHKVGNLGMSFSISGFGIPLQLDPRDQQALLLLARVMKTGFAVIRRQ